LFELNAEIKDEPLLVKDFKDEYDEYVIFDSDIFVEGQVYLKANKRYRVIARVNKNEGECLTELEGVSVRFVSEDV